MVYGSGDNIDHFKEQNLFYLDEVQLICFFSFVVHAFDIIFKKYLPNPRSYRFLGPQHLEKS